MRRIVAAVLVLLTAACALVSRDAGGEPEVRALVERLATAERAGNVPAILGAFADDAVLVPAAGETREGLRAIADHYRLLLAEQSIETSALVEVLEVRGDLAWARGRTTGYIRSRASGGERILADHWLMVLRRADGEWRIVSMLVRP